MCLLIVAFRCRPDRPLIVAANRDEQYARPALPMTVLRAAAPRILGGRDQVGGGTWFAVNQFGVVAGLTNRPGSSGNRRTRGELPLALTRHRTAAGAVAAFSDDYRPADYNPAWLLVGDRDNLFSVDMTSGERPAVAPLEPGLHILENLPPGEPSLKLDHVRALIGDDVEPAYLATVLKDHSVPEGDPRGPVAAACVHTEVYGTRWSGVVTVPADPAMPPELRYADGPPCRTAFTSARWP